MDCRNRMCSGQIRQLASLCFAVAVSIQSPLSSAACQPDPPASGDTVVCNGAVDGGFSAGNLVEITVDVQQGTSFNGGFSVSDSGTVSVGNKGNMQSATLQDNTTVVFTNSGNVNSGISFIGDGDHTVTNLAGGNIDANLSFTGNGNNALVNESNLNPGVVVSGNGTMDILNQAGAFINQRIQVTGATDTTVDNFGTIQGTFTLDTGNDQVINRTGAFINAEVQQGAGNDDFLMEDGTVNGSIQQGAGNDNFLMTGGTINGAVRQGSGDDTFRIEGGKINGSVQQESGQDSASILGGEISGSFNTGSEEDDLLWSGGLVGGIDMQEGDDSATFVGLTDTELRTIEINGGLGDDFLLWDGVIGSRPDRIINWEDISLTNGSVLNMGGNLVLGDSETIVGTLRIDGTSQINATNGQYVIQPEGGAGIVAVINSGTINMMDGVSATDTLTIIGTYSGEGGTLLLDTYLAGDGAPSDRLIADGIELGGTTIIINNVGGPGALTTGDGILVDQDVDGFSTARSFSQGNIVAAGPYEYFLFRGGFSAGTEDNWYLRSSIVSSSSSSSSSSGGSSSSSSSSSGGSTSSSSSSSGGSTSSSSSGSGSSSSSSSSSSSGGSSSSSSSSSSSGGSSSGGGASSGGNIPITNEVIPLYRPEVSVHVSAPSISRALGLATLGTFHEREGEQSWSRRSAATDAIWVRAFGNHLNQYLSGTVKPEFDGDIWGFQVGVPIYDGGHRNSERDIFGVMVGRGGATGDVSGFALAVDDMHTGRLDLKSFNVGGYWTHHWPGGAYFDTVLLYSAFDSETRSYRGYWANIDGREFSASMEGGFNIPLDGTWNLEPQAQLIWQHQRMDRSRDRFSNLNFDDVNALTARIGGRFVADILRGDRLWRPYFKANIWYEDDATDKVMFNITPIYTKRGQASIETGIGLTVDWDNMTSVFGIIDYTTDLGNSDELDAFEARIGFNRHW